LARRVFFAWPTPRAGFPAPGHPRAEGSRGRSGGGS
jgi:hypothetical protein